MTATAPAPRTQIERTEHPHVIKSQGVLGGQPRIDNQRISVLMLLDYYESGASIDEILEGYPTLSISTLLDALSYGYDHPDEMDYWRERQKLRNVLKENDLVYINGRLVPRIAVDRIEIPPGANVYTWDTLPAEYDE
jgi:uncharacterized protein (DUF433 family)